MILGNYARFQSKGVENQDSSKNSGTRAGTLNHPILPFGRNWEIFSRIRDESACI